MNCKVTLAIISMMLLLSSTTAIQAIDDCDGQVLPDGEFFKDGELSENIFVDQIVLNMHDALGFDTRILLAPCVDYSGIQWYLSELTKWQQVFKNPEGLHSDFNILNEVKTLIQTARDQISEDDHIPVQALIQLKIKALSKIEDINPSTSLLGQRIEDIAQMVELLNKAQDVKTAQKLTQIILLKLNESIAEFQEVIDEEENFAQYQSIINDKITQISTSSCNNPPLAAAAQEETATIQQSRNTEVLISSNFKPLETTRTEFEGDQEEKANIAQFIQVAASENEDDNGISIVDDQNDEVTLDADDSNEAEIDFADDSDNQSTPASDQENDNGITIIDENNTSSDEASLDVVENAQDSETERINEKLLESEKAAESEEEVPAIVDAETLENSSQTGVNLNMDGAMSDYDVATDVVVLAEKKAKAEQAPVEEQQPEQESETFEQWEQIFENETPEMEKAAIIFNDFVENPSVDILMDEEKQAFDAQSEEEKNLETVVENEKDFSTMPSEMNVNIVADAESIAWQAEQGENEVINDNSGDNVVDPIQESETKAADETIAFAEEKSEHLTNQSKNAKKSSKQNHLRKSKQEN